MTRDSRLKPLVETGTGSIREADESDGGEANRPETGAMTQDPEKLAACPFCGGEQVSSFHHIVSGMPDSWHVECLAEDCGNGTCHHETEAEAIAAWNRRTPLTDTGEGK